MDNIRLQSRFSDRLAGRARQAPDDARLRKIIGSLQDVHNARVIDWGGGTGAFCARLNADNQFCVVDVSARQLQAARGRGYKTALIRGEDDYPAWLTGWADAVLCGETIEHVVDTDRFLSNINRSMKMGGRLVLTTPNIYNLFTPLMWLLDRPPMFAARYRSEHVRDFTVTTLRLALRNNGFDVRRVRGTTLFSIPFSMPGGEWLADLFPRLSEQLVVVAVKTSEAAYDPDRAVQGRLDDSAIASAFGPKKKN